MLLGTVGTGQLRSTRGPIPELIISPEVPVVSALRPPVLSAHHWQST